jgi:hypothetical protein
LKNKLEAEKSWDAVINDSTARIFFQELKSKPGEHKDKVRATKLLYEIKKALSTWREKAIEVLNFENELFFILAAVMLEIIILKQFMKLFLNLKI